MTLSPQPPDGQADTEAVRICQDLLRIDTTNPGDGTGPGERPAAEYVAAQLAEAGIEPLVVEAAPRRTSVLARVAGTDPVRAPLLVHGHLDTVPFDAADWSRHPLSGDLYDGCLWGRGAVDMKGAVATTLALVRSWARTGRRPRRDIVLAFLADEESTGEFGARFVASRHREHFADCREAIGESGGFSVPARPGAGADGDGARVYPVAVGERGTAWMNLTTTGTAGHGSRSGTDNAVSTLVHALSALAAHSWPTRLTPPVEALIAELERILGTVIDRDRLEAEAVRLGRVGELFATTVRNSATPTVLQAGRKVNVVPCSAHAQVDGRFLPGTREEYLTTVERLLGPGVVREFINLEEAPSGDHSGPAFEAMTAALRAEDPAGHPVPYLMSGGTDAKTFARLGIACYGFAPLLLDPGLHYQRMFHGVDERVPVAGLGFGVRVLDRFLGTY
ncbi:M20/M25/M40 family metallo-hydrolase [Kitasatospora sp. GP82]|uniref:M20/M25/M40 family metallo-hydrolase n=1 Tax=Kitasatospora sp. GP82 TaxID=3035089 RepID=UPI002472EDA6|nr:M20/M25/M40 family metallo-hydrolase [Kitasatospora sp. GP82]MDH6126372.1 acetylornithine deacetylase/succinyl-diaminopimelate desuccinylase-like protein [Kitasatospora sp. GP82]